MTPFFDGEKCLNTVRRIWENDRFGDFSHFEKTSLVVADILKAAGCADVERLRLAADGKTACGDWTMPQAWDLTEGSLRLDNGETLCDTAVTPLCVMMFSAAVEERAFEAVWAEKTAPESWKDRIIYTDGSPKKLVREALRRGAAGIVSDWFPVYPGVRESDDDMDGVSRWENDLFYPENPTDLFGFSLSRAAGAKLRALFESGDKVILRAHIDARSYDGAHYVVSGLIPGEGTDREIMLCGHLYEPGANDNASGCALLCTLAEMLNKTMTGPRLGIRFVMGYESAGMSGYAASHPDRMKKTAAALNCDMVGAASAERATMKIWNSTLSNPDFSYPLLIDEARALNIPFETEAFSIGDCLIADPSIGVPTCSLVMHPARSYHSSMDTPELVDAVVLEKSARLAWTWVMTLAMRDDAAVKRVKSLLDADYARLLETGTRQADFSLRVEAHERALEAFERWAFDDPVPVRKFAGPATLAGRMRREHPELDPFYDTDYNTALFHTDGRRTLRSIIRRTCLELGLEQNSETETRFRRFFDEMNRAGLIEWERS